MKKTYLLIREERERQKQKEGWTNEHDSTHVNGEIYQAAVCYYENNKRDWPWSDDWWKPTFNLGDEGKVKQYIKAGALFLAEKDRIIRDFDLPYQHVIIGHIDEQIGKCEYLIHVLTFQP